jgi:hypothetical protein
MSRNVLRYCAKHSVAGEINADPWRLDLDWRWRQAALDFGCPGAVRRMTSMTKPKSKAKTPARAAVRKTSKSKLRKQAATLSMRAASILFS